MEHRLPRCFLALSLYIFISLSLAPTAFAFSYSDLVNVDGYQYSGCSGSGNFGYTNANYYVCDDNACGGGRLTVAPSPGGCFQSGVFFANRADVSLVAGPTPPPGFTPPAGGPTPTSTPPPCPYTTVNAYFRKGTDPESGNLTVPLNSSVSSFARDQNGTDIPDGAVRYQLIQLTDNFGTACGSGGQCNASLYNGGDGLNLNQTFTWNYNSADAAGTYILYAVPIDAAGKDSTACTNRSIYGTADLTVVGCPYKRTSILIGDRDKDPFDFASYFEEDVDKVSDEDHVFCDYATAPGSCTPGSLPGQSLNGSWLTHTKKNLRFKVLHQDKNGVVSTGAYDGQIIVRRYTGPGTFIEECDTATDGQGRDTRCTSGDGFVDYSLDPNDTSLTALQSGGANKDTYLVQATTLVEKNDQTFEIDAEGCFDTDAVQVDACLYDSTQAYLRNKFAKPDEFKWTANLFALRNDTVTFGAFHNFAHPETQSEPPFATDTVGGLTGPYGINPLYGPGKFNFNPEGRKLDLAGQILNGEHRFDVATNRAKDGTTYKLDKSEFCTGTGTLKVSTNACVSPAPSTSMTKCCPTKPEGTSWSLNPLLGFLLSPFQSLPLRIKLGISSFETTTDTKKVADYFFGKDQEGQVDKGIYFKAAPPYEIAEKFPTETEEIQKRRETAQYSFNLNNPNETELTQGPLENLPAAAFGAERIHKGWAARPLREEDLSTSLNQNGLAAEPRAVATADVHGNVLGSSAPVCSEIRRTFATENTCFTETEGAETNSAGLAEFLTLTQGGLDKLLNLFADKLDWLEAYVRGGNTADTTQPGSAVKRDTAYASGGLNKVFLRPGEEDTTPPEKAGEAKANLVLGFQVKTGGTWQWIPEARIELPLAQAALRYLGGVKETVDFIRQRGLRPGEELPAEPTPSVTPSVTPTPTPPPGTIPQNDTSVNITAGRKAEIINFVKSHWPSSLIESAWDYVYNTGRNYGYNPAFVIALWIEESGGSGVVPAWDFGCTSAPKNNIPAGLTCMNNLSYKNTPWEEFSCRFSEGHYPCTFTINPDFPAAINRYYQCVTQDSCSLF